MMAINDYGKYTLKSFELDYGKVLNNIEVEYKTSGIPKSDENGYITNAIIFCPTHKGDFSVLKNAHSYLKKNSGFNKDEFFFIIITSFGTPDSYSPSTTKLDSEFPEYSIKDIVNFKRQFLKEFYKINKIMGILGEEIGGYEVFTWACEYPDDMNFILILNSDYEITGYKYLLSKGFEAIVDANDDYSLNQYSSSLSRSMIAINSFLFSQSFSEKIFSNLTKTEIDALLQDFVDEGLFINIYDFNLRNNAVLKFDVKDKLKNIKAQTLVIYSNDNIYFKHSINVNVLKDSVENIKIISYDSKKESYYDDEDYSLIGEEVISFLKENI